VGKRKIEERSRELLDLVQLNPPPRSPARRTSGGERQRVAIARSLAAFPPILLADEPTGNLDSRSGAEILDLIRSLHEKLNATILIVTHDAGVARSCSRTIALADARVVADYRNDSGVLKIRAFRRQPQQDADRLANKTLHARVVRQQVVLFEEQAAEWSRFDLGRLVPRLQKVAAQQRGPAGRLGGQTRLPPHEQTFEQAGR